MNDKVGDKAMTSTDELIGSKFPPVKCKYSHTGGNDAKTNVIPGKILLLKRNA